MTWPGSTLHRKLEERHSKQNWKENVTEEILFRGDNKSRSENACCIHYENVSDSTVTLYTQKVFLPQPLTTYCLFSRASWRVSLKQELLSHQNLRRSSKDVEFVLLKNTPIRVCA